MNQDFLKKTKCLLLLYFACNFFIAPLHASVKQTNDTVSLKNAVQRFLQSVDSIKINDVIGFYDDDFKNIRVVDQGPLVKMNRAQMVYFWKTIAGRNQAATGAPTRSQIAALNTTIHFVEITGETGYVLMTRIKDLGSGPETLFYTLVWKFTNNEWRLQREIVHQHTMPKSM